MLNSTLSTVTGGTGKRKYPAFSHSGFLIRSYTRAMYLTEMAKGENDGENERLINPRIIPHAFLFILASPILFILNNTLLKITLLLFLHSELWIITNSCWITVINFHYFMLLDSYNTIAQLQHVEENILCFKLVCVL